ncbi:hypothetical protein F5Y09DRAFT_312429 [Xylaria sp. FL1042]|nr:hypothetical protein F5Y09DRAFT_312429 [Xylaria sp. FL1042]
MQFSTFALAVLGAVGASASSGFCAPGQWTIFSPSNTGFYLTSGDDAVEGLPSFFASCITSQFFICSTIEGDSSISFNFTGGNWTFIQNYNGQTAVGKANFWGPGNYFTYVTPTLVA